MVVSDDGLGIPVHIQESGLANLRHRAHQHGGDMVLSATERAGTVLTWWVPLAQNDKS